MLIYYHSKQTQAKYFLCQVQNQINYVRIKTEIDSTSKIIADGDYSHEIKKIFAPWKKSYDQPRQHIKKQRHYFANQGPYKAMVFPVVM